MSESIYLLSRAVKVIQSCQTPEQLRCAKRFCSLVLRRRWKLVEASTVYRDILRSIDATKLEQELQKLIDQQSNLICKP